MAKTKFIVIQVSSGQVDSRVFQFRCRPELTVSVGRSFGTAIQLYDPLIAPIQVNLRWLAVGSEQHLLMENVLPDLSVSVNAAPADALVLSPGDRIQIGITRLTYWLEQLDEQTRDGLGSSSGSSSDGTGGDAPPTVEATARLRNPRDRRKDN